MIESYRAKQMKRYEKRLKREQQKKMKEKEKEEEKKKEEYEEEPSPYDTIRLTGDDDDDDDNVKDSGTFVNVKDNEKKKNSTLSRSGSVIIHDEIPTPGVPTPTPDTLPPPKVPDPDHDSLKTWLKVKDHDDDSPIIPTDDVAATLKKMDPTERFEDLQLLGTGSYGSVHKMRDRVTNEIVAIKIVRLSLYQSICINIKTYHITGTNRRRLC